MFIVGTKVATQITLTRGNLVKINSMDNNERLIRDNLILTWPKISNKELERIVTRHGELKEVLRFKYKMNKEESVKSAASFFRNYRSFIR